MGTFFRVFFLFLSILVLGSFYPKKVCAQPFGILSQQSRTDSQKQVLSTTEGRFVFGQISGSAKDQFMLDTQTGRLWRISERGDIGMFLKSVPYRISEGKYTPLPENLPDSSEEKNKK